MYVNQIMTSDIKTCTLSSNLEEAARLMWDHDCGAIPVINAQGCPIGIVTDRDVAMAAVLNHKPLWEINVSTIIEGQHLSTCKQGDQVTGCVQKMEQSGVRRLPVVNEDGRLAGLVSMGDVMAFVGKDNDNDKGNGKAKTKNGNDAKPGDEVPVSLLVSMLQRVSGHHDVPARPLVAARLSL